MYSIFLGLAFLNEFRPYFRKYISNSLDNHEYFFLNALIIIFIISFYILYLLLNKKTTFSKFISNIYSLSYTEITCVFILALLAVVTGLLIFELDKNYNTPLINSVFLRAISSISLIFIGIFIFKENYKIHQFIGIFLIILGIYLTSQKNLSIFGL